MNSRIMELENLVMTISLNQKEQSKSQNIENKIKQIDENKQIKIENESNFPAIQEENYNIIIICTYKILIFNIFIDILIK